MIRSRSISSSARSASKWCIITSFPPAAVLTTMLARQPVAWKSGTDSRNEFCEARRRSRREPGSAAGPAWPMKNRFMRFVQALRCVPTAPFGRPVVPEV